MRPHRSGVFPRRPSGQFRPDHRPKPASLSLWGFGTSMAEIRNLDVMAAVSRRNEDPSNSQVAWPSRGAAHSLLLRSRSALVTLRFKTANARDFGPAPAFV